jgi:hypothetical protein
MRHLIADFDAGQKSASRKFYHIRNDKRAPSDASHLVDLGIVALTDFTGLIWIQTGAIYMNNGARRVSKHAARAYRH